MSSKHWCHFRNIALAGLTAGSLFGLFTSFQVLILNGILGLNRDTFLLLTYLTVPSVVVFTLLASIVYSLFLLGSKLWSGKRCARRGTLVLLVFSIFLLLVNETWNWFGWGGSDSMLYSVLSAIFTLTLIGVGYFFLKPGSGGVFRLKRALLPTIILLVVFTASFLYYRHLWEQTYDPDLVSPPHPEGNHKALVIGIDSANWHVMDRLLANGDLPNFQSVIQDGVRGPLKTFQPTASPIIWTSIVTGKHYRQHGVDGFAYYNIPGLSQSIQAKGTVLSRFLLVLRRRNLVSFAPYSSQARKCSAIWNILNRSGFTVGVANWMGSWPVDEVNGFMVSNRFLDLDKRKGLNRGMGLIWPDSLYDRAMDLLNRSAYDHLPSFVKEFEKSDSLLFGDFIDDLEHIERKLDVTISLTKSYDPDVVLFYDHFLDAMQHRFWRFMEPEAYAEEIPADDVERYGDLVRYTYIYFDHVVGRLIESVGEDRDVIIISDHGMEPIPLKSKKMTTKGKARSKQLYRVISAHHYMAPPGILIARGGRLKNGVEIHDAGVYDILPTLLYLLGLPVASDMKGRVLEGIVDESYFAGHPPSYIKSYEKERFSRKRRMTLTDEDEEILNSFRALGYIQ